MTSEHDLGLRRLLNGVSVAALGTIEERVPFVSMVPFAVTADGKHVLIHVSRLAAHTRNMHSTPAVSLMVMEPEGQGKPPQGLARVTIQGVAQAIARDSADHARLKREYLGRFPESEGLFSFPDFDLFTITVQSARYVGGFAQARTLSAAQFATAAGPASD